MRLASPGFEQRFRTLYRGEMRRSPEWRKEARRARRPRQIGTEATTQALISVAIVVFLFTNKASRGMDLEYALAAIALWTAGTAFLRAHRYFETFYGSRTLAVLAYLPMPDADIFRVLWRNYWKGFLFVLIESTLLYVALGMTRGRPEIAYFGALLGGMQTLLALAVALHAAVFLHRLPLNLLGVMLRLGAAALVLGWPKLAGYHESILAFGRWFFPTGWLNYALAEYVLRQHTLALGLLIPIGALIYGAKYSWARLRAFYSLEGLEVLPAAEAAAAAAPELARRGATDIADRLAGRQFLLGVDWSRAAWLERLIGRFFRGRDRLVLEFLVAENPGWSQSFRTGVWLWGLGAVAIWTFGNALGPIVYLPVYLLAATTLPLLGGNWRGLHGFPAGGVMLPAYAVYPISFNEISRTLAKVNLIRIAVAAPLLVSFGVLAAWKLRHPPLAGAIVSLKVLLLLLALQPVLNLLPISKATNDTTRMKVLWGFVFLPVALMLVGLSFFFLALNVGQGTIGIFGLIVLLSVATFSIYRRAFRRGKFDLLARRLSGLSG